MNDDACQKMVQQGEAHFLACDVCLTSRQKISITAQAKRAPI